MPPRPFVDQPVGNAEAAHVLAAHVADTLHLAEPTLLRVGMNALFRAGDVVVRVGRPSAPARLSIDLAVRLRDPGIAVPAPAVADVFADGELSATCWRWLPDSGRSIDWHEVGAIVRRVHALSGADLP